MSCFIYFNLCVHILIENGNCIAKELKSSYVVIYLDVTIFLV
jgi:hypothetical protein